MLTRLLAGAVLLGGLVLCAPVKAQDPAGVTGDPATTNRSTTPETLRENNKAAAKERRAENKRVKKEHKTEIKHAGHETPRPRRAHEHGAKPIQTHGSKRTNPNRAKSSHPKNEHPKSKIS